MKNIYKTLGDNIKKRRKELGLTQEKLSKKSGLHRTYIVGVETGKRNISLKNINKIARALKIPPKKLLE